MLDPAADSTDTDTCKELQQEEWLVLESIYPDCVSSSLSDGSLKLEIPIDLGGPHNVTVVDDGTTPSYSANAPLVAPPVQSLASLPPLLLNLILPPAYPLHCPPQIVSFHATHSWLPSSTDLPKILQEKWQEGEGVLYTWVEWIRDGGFLDELRLRSVDGNISIPHPAPHILSPLLSAHDNAMKINQFSQNSYVCAVCLTSLKGSRCLQLAGCSHVFCRTCLEEFWGMCIAEGDVGRVGCPDPGCVKEGREVGEEEVRRVVSEQEVMRWRWLREKRALDRDPTLIHCPMDFCQTPVPKPRVDDSESGWARLRTCPSCEYSFCAFCKRSWHGPISDCPVSVLSSLVAEYIALPRGSPRLKVLEQRFGRQNIARLVAKYEEDQANKQYLDASTMACPGCCVRVEKSFGCNHMTCAKCKMHFCYRCGSKLNGSNPYQHFSTPGLPCYSKLFDFQSVEEEGWQPVEGFDFI